MIAKELSKYKEKRIGIENKKRGRKPKVIIVETSEDVVVVESVIDEHEL